MTKSFLGQVAEIVGSPVYIQKFDIDSYMGKVYEEGRYCIYQQREFPPDWKGPRQNAYTDPFVAEFSFVSMPGCCGIVVSTASLVAENHRNRGLGTLLNEMRRELAYQYRYGLMICTDLASNTPQQKVLERNGWSTACTFQNPRTLNTVNLHYVHLLPTGIPLGFDPEQL